MTHKLFLSRLVSTVFAVSISVGYCGVAAGLLGYLNLGKASLVTLIASSVACADVGVFFLLSFERLARRRTD